MPGGGKGVVVINPFHFSEAFNAKSCLMLHKGAVGVKFLSKNSSGIEGFNILRERMGRPDIVSINFV